MQLSHDFILHAFWKSNSETKEPFSLYQGNTLSFTIAFVSLVDFQNVPKMESRLSGVAGKQETKNPKLYF